MWPYFRTCKSVRGGARGWTPGRTCERTCARGGRGNGSVGIDLLGALRTQSQWFQKSAGTSVRVTAMFFINRISMSSGCGSKKLLLGEQSLKITWQSAVHVCSCWTIEPCCGQGWSVLQISLVVSQIFFWDFTFHIISQYFVFMQEPFPDLDWKDFLSFDSHQYTLFISLCKCMNVGILLRNIELGSQNHPVRCHDFFPQWRNFATLRP